MGYLCLTFDDLYVENWVAALPIFERFGARVTFCVSHLHLATDAQIKGLHLLQDAGHEIAFHTRTHPKLGPYLKTHGIAHWLRQEIDAGIAEHHVHGFPAASFASPYHGSTPQTRMACAERFAVVRAAGPRGTTEANISQRIYRSLGPDHSVDNLGFCDLQHRAFPGWDQQMHLLDEIVAKGGVGVFTGHDIKLRARGLGFYSAHRPLRRFLRAARDRALGFCTLREVGLVAA